MTKGTKFNAIRKDGRPVTRRKFENGTERTLAEFTATNLVIDEGISWIEAVVEGHPLKGGRPYHLLTRLFDFHVIETNY